jgi:hypothetical protein
MSAASEVERIRTPYGIWGGVVSFSTYPGGAIKSVSLCEKNILLTHAGELTPFFGAETPRRKNKPGVVFFESGLVKSVFLDKQQEILTPIGEFPAEFVSFYETGQLRRFFPLDGKISGFWTEEDERELNIPLSFDLGFTSFTAMLNGLCFYKSGAIRSLSLFPGERITVRTKYGPVDVKNGVSLYENGALESCEPDAPTMITTPIGAVSAYDVNAVGVSADSNSLRFREDGGLKSLVTSSDRITARDESDCPRLIAPFEKYDPDENRIVTRSGVGIDFDYANDSVTFTGEESYRYSLSKSAFTVVNGPRPLLCSSGDCSGCSLCAG